jgi:hypothetical protein
MALIDLFKDENDINEKSVLGFLSFGVLTIYASVDIVTGYFGQQFVIEPVILEIFAALTGGCFGIAAFEKVKNRQNETERQKALGGQIEPYEESEG